MARGRKAGDPFSKLEDEFKDRCTSASPEELKGIVCETAKNQELNLAAQKADQDLKTQKALAAEAGAVYKEGSKRNKLKMKFLIQTLSDRGDAQSQEIIQLLLAGA